MKSKVIFSVKLDVGGVELVKCVKCGRRGLFLITNSAGICSECVEEIVKNTNRYYYDIALKRQDLNKEIVMSGSANEKLNFIPEYEQRIELCNKVIEMINTYRNMPMAKKILLEKLTYDKAIDKSIHYAFLPCFNVYVWNNKDNAYDNLISSILENVNNIKNQCYRKVEQIKKFAAFYNELLSIPSSDIVLSKEKAPILSTSNLSDIIYSNITSKSNYLKLSNYIVVDIETTGLSSAKDEIIEISAIKFEDFEPASMFSTLIKPKKDIPKEITDLTGISNEMVENAPSIYEITPGFLEFIGKENIIGHNLKFDLGFLYKNGINPLNKKRKYYDTLGLVKTVLKKPKTKWDKEYQEYEIDYESEYDIEDYKLTTLCDYYQIRDNEMGHRSLSDAYATGILFKNIVSAKISY